MSGPPATTRAAQGPTPRGPGLALGLMAASSLLFASMNILARLASASASWVTVSAVRAAIGAMVAFSVARLRGVSVRPKRLTLIFWRSVFGTISMVTTFYALSSHTVSLGDTVTLMNLSPVFLALVAPIFLRERTSPLVAVSILLALAGVILVVRPSFVFGGGPVVFTAFTGPSAAVTTLTAVTAAVSTTIAMMVVRRVGQSEVPEAIAFAFSCFAFVILTIVSLFHFQVPTPRDTVLMVLAGVCAGFAQLAMTRAYTLESAARVSGLSYISVVASAALGAAVLGEKPGPTALIGTALVIAGGVLATRREAGVVKVK